MALCQSPTAAEAFPNTISTQVEDDAALDRIISKLLGQGLGYDEWKIQLKKQGDFTWSESLKNTIIKKEFGFFKEEILRLKSEPNKSRALQSKTNSLESILKRLQGVEWANGMPNEMEERRRSGRLLGKDAKARCLQYHVSRWKKNATSASKSSPNTKASKDLNRNDTKSTCVDQPITSTASPTLDSPRSSLVDNSTLEIPERSNVNDFTSFTSTATSHSTMASLFGQDATVPACDPTLYGYTEIPWVPLFASQETQAKDMDMTSDEFFQFIELNPCFPNESTCKDISFELPREDGTNDSYSTYIADVTQNSSTQMKILEEILDSYGPLPNQDKVLSDSDWVSLDQEYGTATEMSPFIQKMSPTFENFGISPQDLMQNEGNAITSEIEVDEICRNNGIEALAFSNVSDTNDPTTIQNQQQAQAELRKKKDELAAAVALVSTLRKEIKSLEVSSLGSSGNLRYTNKHKCAEDESPHQAKRMKEKATAPSFTSSFNKESSFPKETYLETRKEYFSNRSDTTRDSSSVYSNDCAKSPSTTNHRQFSGQSKQIPEDRMEQFSHSKYASIDLGNLACGLSFGSFVGKLEQTAVS